MGMKNKNKKINNMFWRKDLFNSIFEIFIPNCFMTCDWRWLKRIILDFNLFQSKLKEEKKITSKGSPPNSDISIFGSLMVFTTWSFTSLTELNGAILKLTIAVATVGITLAFEPDYFKC